MHLALSFPRGWNACSSRTPIVHLRCVLREACSARKTVSCVRPKPPLPLWALQEQLFCLVLITKGRIWTKDASFLPTCYLPYWEWIAGNWSEPWAIHPQWKAWAVHDVSSVLREEGGWTLMLLLIFPYQLLTVHYIEALLPFLLVSSLNMASFFLKKFWDFCFTFIVTFIRFKVYIQKSIMNRKKR